MGKQERDAVKAVMDREPLLTVFGFGPVRDPALDSNSREFEENRKAMLGEDALKQFALCCEWLGHATRTKSVNPRFGTSYGIKHRVEQAAGEYITNGMLICAAIHMGFKVRREDNSAPNAEFNIAIRSVFPTRLGDA